MSETKETEPGAEPQADSTKETEALSSTDEGEGAGGRAPTPADPVEVQSAPKKTKRKSQEGEPEAIKDRNARVRAEAAEKRRARRAREQAASPRRNLDASEVVDDALARSTHAAAGFLTKYFNKVQWVIIGGLAGWIAWEVYAWRHARTTEKATAALFKALSAETGRVGADTSDADESRGPSDARRTFASDQERLKAAKQEYVLAETSMAGSDGAVLADLGAAGVAYDLGQYKEAQAAYEKVRNSPEFQRDHDIKGRTLEGLGMALEAQKQDAAALKVFHELGNMDEANFAALGLYDQARMLKAQGKTDEALKLLDKAGQKLLTLKDNPAAIKYVAGQVLDLLDGIDPKKARELNDKLMPPDAMKKMMEGGGGGSKLSPELQKRLQELMQKQRSAPAPMPGPVAPPANEPTGEAPAPAPEAPAPTPSGAP